MPYCLSLKLKIMMLQLVGKKPLSIHGDVMKKLAFLFLLIAWSGSNSFGTDITYSTKSTGDQFTAADANEIKTAVNSKANSADLGTASTRDAEDTLTDGSNLPDGAAVTAFADARYLRSDIDDSTTTDLTFQTVNLRTNDAASVTDIVLNGKR